MKKAKKNPGPVPVLKGELRRLTVTLDERSSLIINHLRKAWTPAGMSPLSDAEVIRHALGELGRKAGI